MLKVLNGYGNRIKRIDDFRMAMEGKAWFVPETEITLADIKSDILKLMPIIKEYSSYLSKDTYVDSDAAACISIIKKLDEGAKIKVNLGVALPKGTSEFEDRKVWLEAGNRTVCNYIEVIYNKKKLVFYQDGSKKDLAFGDMVSYDTELPLPTSENLISLKRDARTYLADYMA